MFAVGLGLGIRTSELHSLLVRELNRETLNVINAWVFYPEIGSVAGKSKNRRGGIKAIKNKQQASTIYDMDILDDTLNV